MAHDCERTEIRRLTGTVTIDGDLSDEAWQHATRIDKWYETSPGDNVEPGDDQPPHTAGTVIPNSPSAFVMLPTA